ncbi:MAG: hypothetical protein JSV85_02875 [Candidatus Bathyarchaeota archaeon]|nr:MAG: hypothetical protein JSV85_02875 [Candidatus Bathyarchaeota archaeon]
MSVAYIDIRFFAHATEDPDKVVEAARNILPDAYVDDIAFELGNLRGHYGNLIVLYKTRIKKKEIISAVTNNLFSRLGESSKKSLHKEIKLHVKKGSFYLRLDKQAALLGELKLCTADPICLRLRFKNVKSRHIVETYEELGIIA